MIEILNGIVETVSFNNVSSVRIYHNRETDDYRYIYQMRPGITSYATIYNGYTDTMDKMLKRLEYDLDYLDNRNIFTDLGIIARTFFSVFSGKKF